MGLGFEFGARPPGPFRVYAADYSLPSGRCSFNHIAEVVYLYFTTVLVFANVNKTKSITWPSESAVKGFERLCCYLGTDRAPSGPIPLRTGWLWIWVRLKECEGR